MQRLRLLVSLSFLSSPVLLFVHSLMRFLILRAICANILRILLCFFWVIMTMKLGSLLRFLSPSKFLLLLITFRRKEVIALEWLADNWDSLMTILNTIGLLFVSRHKSQTKE